MKHYFETEIDKNRRILEIMVEKTSSEEIMLKALKKRYNRSKGIEKESILYKIENIKKSMRFLYRNHISTSRVVAFENLKNKIYVDENLVKGYKKIIRSDPSLEESLKPICEFICKKVMLLDREFTMNNGMFGEKIKFHKTSGTIMFNFIDVQCDPIFEIERIDFYVDSKKKASFNIKDQGSIPIYLENNSEIEILMVGKEEVLIGIVYLPCDFFIDKNGKIINFDFRNFNTASLKLEFKRQTKLIRKNAEIRCVYVAGHGLENYCAMSPAYCSVCYRMLPLFTSSMRCLRCKFTCHKRCSAFVLFNCKDSIVVDVEKVKKRYDIEHSLEERVPSGFRYCAHCGERISASEVKSYECTMCDQRFHRSCKDLIFNSCGIDQELRKTMAEFNPPSPETSDVVQKVSIHDFTLVRVLGRGNFGKVMLAKHKGHGELLALKILKKEKIVNTNDIFYIELEKKVLKAISSSRHPFLMNMRFCFQDSANLFFVTEYISGGDLFHHALNQAFDDDQIRLYASEMLLGLQFLHSKNIIYRDFKLDNIMISSDGHLKIVDFGLCKDNIGPFGVTFTYCGTPDTIAPEMILGNGYTKDVDWWSYGVVIYELYERSPPFSGVTNREMCESILKNQPIFMRIEDEISRDLILRLLEKNPRKRLGYGENDGEDVKAHRYFNGISWEDVFHKRTKPKLVPGDEKSNFDRDFTDEPVMITPPTSMRSYDQFFTNF